MSVKVEKECLKNVLEHFSTKLSPKEVESLEELLDAPKYFYRNLFFKLGLKQIFSLLEVDQVKKVIKKSIKGALEKELGDSFNSVLLDIRERVDKAFNFDDIEEIIKPYRNFPIHSELAEELINLRDIIIYRLIHLLKDSVSFGGFVDTDKSHLKPRHMGRKFGPDFSPVIIRFASETTKTLLDLYARYVILKSDNQKDKNLIVKVRDSLRKALEERFKNNEL